MLRTLTTVALFVLAATAANARDAVPSTIVDYSDLNLSHPADAKILAGRLETAAALVCRTAGSGQPAIPGMHTKRECMHNAVNVALARIATTQTNAVKVYLADARAEY